jgi:hypothetical protein
MTKYHQLWSTKIFVDKLDKSIEWNNKLAEIAEDYSESKMVKYASGFKHAIPNNMLLQYKSKELTEYFDILVEFFWRYIETVAGIKPEDITKPTCHMFGNVEKRGQWSIPHAHHGNQVVITYYPKVVRDKDEPHPSAGDMVFHNPRFMQSGFWNRKEFLFTTMGVETGTLVAFPAIAEHSTFPLFCEGSSKHAIVCNVRFTGMLEGENSHLQYQTFETLKEKIKQ